MSSFISEAILASAAAHLLSGDNGSMWAAVGTMFLAIFLVVGGLLTFLIKVARRDGMNAPSALVPAEERLENTGSKEITEASF